jgi:proline iminopeptidase
MFADWKIDDIKFTSHNLTHGVFTTAYRIWGTGPIKALFLHGGPGQAFNDYRTADGVYHNYQILNPEHYTVLEVDQLGTGLSQPSLRNGLENSSLYLQTCGQELVQAIVEVLNELKWDRVFLHGGSWGSSLALWFAQIHPSRVCGMVIRGIFTGTLAEMDVTYTRRGAGTNSNMISAFDSLLVTQKPQTK